MAGHKKMQKILTEWRQFLTEQEDEEIEQSSRKRGPYMAKSHGNSQERRYDGTHSYKKAERALSRAEEEFPILVGALTKDIMVRDACLQELSAASEYSTFDLGIERTLEVIEKALFNYYNYY